MQVFHEIERFTPPPGGITLTIGNFDGVHRGHQRIVQKAREVAADLGTPACALTFEPHPLAVIAPAQAPGRLVTLDEKLHLLGALGVEVCIVMPSEPALLHQPAETFLTSLTARCRPRALVEGPDFNFGRGRAGSVQTLHALADRLGFTVHVIETARCDELPSVPSVHSAAIRAALREGRVDIAQHMLGRPYRIVGTVAPGAGRGGGLGFPTANLDAIPHLLPQQAVYAAVAQLEDDRLHLAAVNIGGQPTFGPGAPQVEAHLLDWDAALRGQRLGLHFLARLRAQTCFSSPGELGAQIQRDVAATRTRAAALSQLRQARPLPLVG